MSICSHNWKYTVVCYARWLCQRACTYAVNFLSLSHNAFILIVTTSIQLCFANGCNQRSGIKYGNAVLRRLLLNWCGSYHRNIALLYVDKAWPFWLRLKPIIWAPSVRSVWIWGRMVKRNHKITNTVNDLTYTLFLSRVCYEIFHINLILFVQSFLFPSRDKLEKSSANNAATTLTPSLSAR